MKPKNGRWRLKMISGKDDTNEGIWDIMDHFLEGFGNAQGQSTTHHDMPETPNPRITLKLNPAWRGTDDAGRWYMRPDHVTWWIADGVKSANPRRKKNRGQTREQTCEGGNRRRTGRAPEIRDEKRRWPRGRYRYLSNSHSPVGRRCVNVRRC